MNHNRKKDVLFIKDENSMFNADTQMFDQLFHKVDKAKNREEALEFFDKNEYDFVIGDLSVKPEGVAFLKQIKDIKSDQIIFAMVSPKDTDKLFSIADLGINAFELTPEQFDQALESIAEFEPEQ